MVNYNTAHLLDKMFSTLYSAIKPELTVQIIVIDNASADNSVDVLRNKYPEVKLITNQVNVGFGRANNQGLPFIEGRYVLLLNTDAFVSPDTLSKTIAYMDANPRCGILGAKLVGRDGELQPSCRFFPTPWNIFLIRTGFSRFFINTRMVDDPDWDHASVRQCDWVPGCYYLIRHEVIEQVGLFDPRYFLYSEEVDHCLEVKKAGWEVTYYPDTTVVHIGGESAKSAEEITASGRQIKRLQVESELLYFRKHHGLGGLLLHLSLSLFADFVVMLKLLIKTKDFSWVASGLKLMHLRLMLCFNTAFGSRPTR